MPASSRAGQSVYWFQQRAPILTSLNSRSFATMSTEISTAGIVPLFSSQWVVFRSSGQPTPGP